MPLYRAGYSKIHYMKNSLLVIVIIGLFVFSCNKSGSDEIPTSLEGSWKMILVTNNSTGSTFTKPSSITKDVIITFIPSSATTGTFTGKTPTNNIDQNGYSLGSNQSISIPELSMTKVAETSWGAEFVDNIRSAEQYHFERKGKLVIESIHKTLTFEKL
jgi:hypothetical protein